ncbi:MAG: Rpn family recombination-promoting nuclease/putative transposase, partial [Firmicutes bacterium]|nr:Rpn family recombination-promoting nuclease/putative transposase [Bacillota bacterium]
MIYQIQPFETLPLKHTFMFGQVMQKPEICQLFLEELFGWDIERIEYVDREKDITDRYLGRGIRLDIYIRNSDAVYNIEVQSQEEKSLERRIRFYQSGIDREELRRGVSYESLPETYIIFICDYDPIKVGNALYERKAFW